jgi:hypothetical protein
MVDTTVFWTLDNIWDSEVYNQKFLFQLLSKIYRIAVLVSVHVRTGEISKNWNKNGYRHKTLQSSERLNLSIANKTDGLVAHCAAWQKQLINWTTWLSHFRADNIMLPNPTAFLLVLTILTHLTNSYRSCALSAKWSRWPINLLESEKWTFTISLTNYWSSN